MIIDKPNEYGEVTRSQLDEMFAAMSIRLPIEYKEFLLESNGGTPKENLIEFGGKGDFISTDIQYFYSVNCIESYCDLRKNIALYSGRIDPQSIPIATDSGGNLFLIKVKGTESGAIYYWDHSRESMSFGCNHVYVADSFKEFSKMLIEYKPDNESEIDKVIRENNIDAFEKLIAEGYDFERLDEWNRSLLENCVIQNRVRMVKILLKKNAQIRSSLDLAKENQKFFGDFEEIIDVLTNER